MRWLCWMMVLLSSSLQAQEPGGGALKGEQFRVIVSTDIGGTDPDDFQSMAHFLLYADCFDVKGLISSPYGPGRAHHILQVLDQYAIDYPKLKAHSNQYPNPEFLRLITKQGALYEAPYCGYAESTVGSQWLVDVARSSHPHPLYVLVWGGLEDVAQALHDAPDILPKLRVYWIGGPNKKWSVNAYQYIVNNHRDLWMIEANATYRGWFVGGNQAGQWGNKGFVTEHVRKHGALGEFFATQLGGTIKMGDTPSVAWLLRGTPTKPELPSWGGQFVRAWKRPFLKLDRMPVESDRLEEFGILEIELPVKETVNDQSQATISVEGQQLNGYFAGDGKVRFRFSPKASKSYEFKVESNLKSLQGQSGTLTSYRAAPELRAQPSAELPNWWTDDPALDQLEGPHIGAKSVNRWREQFLSDFAARLDLCK